MRLEPESRWYLLPRPDLVVERSAKPQILTIDATVDWIKRNKPLLWVGSIFSVPEPSGFPSGYAVTHSLLDVIFPAAERLPKSVSEQMIKGLMPRWSLDDQRPHATLVSGSVIRRI
jgi:hypothetical protein